jgi:hypothetical protein
MPTNTGRHVSRRTGTLYINSAAAVHPRRVMPPTTLSRHVQPRHQNQSNPYQGTGSKDLAHCSFPTMHPKVLSALAYQRPPCEGHAGIHSIAEAIRVGLDHSSFTPTAHEMSHSLVDEYIYIYILHTQRQRVCVCTIRAIISPWSNIMIGGRFDIVLSNKRQSV